MGERVLKVITLHTSQVIHHYRKKIIISYKSVKMFFFSLTELIQVTRAAEVVVVAAIIVCKPRRV